MPFAAFFNGTILPLMLMLSPLAVMAAAPFTGWHTIVKMTKMQGHKPCTSHQPPLM
ncbi:MULTISPECIES: hypothetical protein [Sphingobium]|uniref:hypothetical protein n=1 Tax=Sphingobium TaxID=165695 RepID=UPI000DBB9F1D|nr:MULTISPECIES: hypothetical protein [Sphingobium]MBU0931079.1 hypothetical protein [Alphaproteobacteria bacterium]BBD00842.1 hypothetical protein YGS_C1P2097 [Sphingobium sp. YG1]